MNMIKFFAFEKSYGKKNIFFMRRRDFYKKSF